MLILADWEHAKDHVEQWAAEHPSHPALNGALARKYAELHEYDKSEKFWKAYLKVAPDAAAYRELADDYLRDGHEDLWLATLKESLAHEDYGLEHSVTNEKIARHYMNVNAFEKARPYADAAAESGSGAAFMCAAECYEGLKQWDKAEGFMKANAERYERPIDWLFWCRRTGHGDVAGAEAASRAYLKATSARDDDLAQDQRADVYLLTGEPGRAVEPLARAFETRGDPWSAAHLGLALVEQGKKEAARDALLKGAARGMSYRLPNSQVGLPGMVAIDRMMAAGIQPGTKFTVADVTGLVKNLPVYQKIDVCYVAGKFMEIQGQKQEAMECFRQAAYTNEANRLDAILAIGELRAAGLLPKAY